MQVLYFASIREQFDIEGEQIERTPDTANVQALIDFLCKIHGEPWSKVLGDPNLLVSVNQELASLDAPLSASDEVAFFPPVTGG